MSFYTFNQNNSGGSFHYDNQTGISHYVVVEADTEDEAIDRAESIGLYFDGDGDCECCGSRWSTYIDPFDEPGAYESGEFVLGSKGVFEYTETEWGWMDEFEGFVHYKDGNIVPVLIPVVAEPILELETGNE